MRREEKILVCLRKANSCLERSASYWIEKENNCYPIPHYWGEKENLLQKVFRLNFEKTCNNFYQFKNNGMFLYKREHKVVRVNRLKTSASSPTRIDSKFCLKISAEKWATLQYFNLEEQQQSQIKLKFLLKYACSQNSKNIFPQSISKLLWNIFLIFFVQHKV